MAVSDLFEMLDAFIPTDDDDSDSKSAVSKDTHLSLWKRANLGVKVLIREERRDEATKCILAFFRDFEDLGELEGIVKEIEDLVTRPRSQKEKRADLLDSSSSDPQPDSSL